MKRYIRASWIDPDIFTDEDFDMDNFDMEQFWEDYLCYPEDSVNSELQIFLEPSGQASYGSMIIYDESGEDRFEPVEVDLDIWNNEEIEMAMNSSSSEDYADKYRAYIKQLCNI